MSSSSPEIVPPSSEPDAAVSTGSGSSSGGGTPPPDPSQSGSTNGLGPQTEQKGGAPKGDAPYSLTGDDDDTPARSESGT